MTTVVLDSADLVESVMTGVTPVPKGIAEDNASQAAKRTAAQEEPKEKVVDNVEKPTEVAEPLKAETPDDNDDEEGEDGLTARQKRDFTKAMLATIAKKHRAQREAEELAASEYNRGRLAEQRAEQLSRENARLKEQLNPPVEEVKAPVRDDFETEQAFQDAVIDYRVDQRLKAQALEDAKKRDSERLEAIRVQAEARIDKARELVSDFDEVVGEIDMPVPDYIAGYMQKSDMFAELGYHFAKHPELLQKLTAMSPDSALVEVGKIESTLAPFASPAKANGVEPSQTNGKEPSTETGSAPSKPRVQAPIIRPLNAGSGAQVEKDEADMTGSQVISAWQRKHGVKLTARKRH